MKTTTFLTLLFTTLFLGTVPIAKAKPLSYVGGTMVMQENDETGYTLSIDYTFNPHLALGMYSKYEIGGNEFWMAGPQLNGLIKRWNLPDGQGNIFSMTGVGMARQGSNNQPGAWAALLADYETRRWSFLAMGESGMGNMAEMAGMMPGPKNTLPMMLGTGQFGSIDMGGMFTVLKIRDGITNYDDPGWYQNPPGTVASPISGSDSSNKPAHHDHH
jgi:hypothetical protein